MNAITAPLPLADVLGASWVVGSGTNALAWDGAAGSAWFGLEDGSLAVARSAWEGRAGVRPREGGGVELVAGTEAAPPVARIKVHQGACLALAAEPDAGVLSGGADGELARVAADGTIDTLVRLKGVPAAPIAAGRGGWRVCAAGSVLVRLGAEARTLDLPETITALAVAPNGARVAIGQASGVTLWAGGDTPRALAAEGGQTAVVWSKDSRVLASVTEAGDVLIWDVGAGKAQAVGERQPGRAVGFLADGRVIASAGGAVVCHDLSAKGVEPCGANSRETVQHLACHPRRALVAAGYSNGAIAICRPGIAEIVLVRGAGDGPVTTLGWSPAGDTLAYATPGSIGLVALPGLLFREGAAP